MTNISRPFQIALLALGLFVAVWFVALRGHSASTTGAGSSPSAAAPAVTAKAVKPPSPASQGKVYHGSAPGVAGLSRAISKAQGAVAQSKQNAKQLSEKSAQASSSAAAATGGASSSAAPSQAASALRTHRAAAAAAAAKQAASKAASVKSAAKSTAAAGSSTAAGSKVAPAKNMQGTVEAELKQGKIVMVLFWTPKSAVDSSVRRELQATNRQLHGQLAVHVALANQVGSFGSFTRTVQVYGTPTILVINKHGETASLTGLTDVFSLKQAIAEAKQAQ
jgi:hypothetical protein